jgi:hypothetical protein
VSSTSSLKLLKRSISLVEFLLLGKACTWRGVPQNGSILKSFGCKVFVFTKEKSKILSQRGSFVSSEIVKLTSSRVRTLGCGETVDTLLVSDMYFGIAKGSVSLKTTSESYCA